jgi:predicted kinase
MEVVLLIGLPASGKSTFYRQRLAETHLHISKDNFKNARSRIRRQRRMLEEALAAGQSVVVDNTNVTREQRTGIIEPARAAGARVVGYVFESIVQDCRERNALREGEACVPLVAIYAAAKHYERPSNDEGFDALHFVRLTPSGFSVEEWRESDEAERV